MARKIQQFRGLERDLPTLAEGQIGFATDTKRVYIGSNEGNVRLVKIDEVGSSAESLTNVKKITPKRLANETSDSPAIQRAINSISSTGGILEWQGTLEIVEPILINDEKVQFRGIGEYSKIKVIRAMDYAIKVDYHSQYGTRGLNWSDFYLDCNNLAQDGLVLGGNNPTVQSMFSNIKIYNALHYGLVLDATQNCLFNLVDAERCAGNLYILNGAGNNTFMKCEFNESRGLHHIYIGSDENYNGYGNNGFDDTPQMNHFFNCITERGAKETCIFIEYGKSNTFTAHEFESGDATDCVIRMSEGANLNHISGRIAHSGSTRTPIINEGYRNFISDFYVENGNSQYFAETSRELYLQNVFLSNGSVKINNIGGDRAGNIRTVGGAIYTWSDPYTTSSLPSQFLYSEAGLFFRAKDEVYKILTKEAHEASVAPHNYGGKFEWRYNSTTNSLDLVVLD